MGKIRKKDLENQSSSLMIVMACILIVMMFCYFGLMNKGTYSAASCANGYTEVSGYCCPSEFNDRVAIKDGVTYCVNDDWTIGTGCKATATESNVQQYRDKGYFCNQPSGSTIYNCSGGDITYCGVKASSLTSDSDSGSDSGVEQCYKCISKSNVSSCDSGYQQYFTWTYTPNSSHYCTVSTYNKTDCLYAGSHYGISCLDSCGEGLVMNKEGKCVENNNVEDEDKCFKCTSGSITTYSWASNQSAACRDVFDVSGCSGSNTCSEDSSITSSDKCKSGSIATHTISFREAADKYEIKACSTDSNGKLNDECVSAISSECASSKWSTTKWDGKTNNQTSTVSSSWFSTKQFTSDSTYYCVNPVGEGTNNPGDDDPVPSTPNPPNNNDPDDEPDNDDSGTQNPPTNNDPDDEPGVGGPVDDTNEPSNPDTPNNPDNSDNKENAPENPGTGSGAIFMCWIITLATLVYSFWYFKNAKYE